MTKLALFIFLGDAGAPSVHAGDTKDARRDVFDVCNQFVINEPDRPISFGFTRTGTARAMIMATIILSIQESASVPSTPIPRRPTAICDGVNASAAEVPFAKVPFRAQMDFK